MMHGYSLSASLPEEFALGERFWYWRGASGQSYIHSIYSPDQCPPVAGAVFVLVRKIAGMRQAVRVGLFGSDGILPTGIAGQDDEVHVHLLTRDPEAAGNVQQDLASALAGTAATPIEPRPYRKPVQLDLLAA